MSLDVFCTEQGYDETINVISEKYLSTIKGASKILIKVDLYAGNKSPETGAITNIELIEKIIVALNEYAYPEKIIIAESGNMYSASETFEFQKYFELKKKYANVSLLDLDAAPQIKIQNDKFKIIKNISIAEDLISCDYLINVSNFKRHITERISGCCINLFNCVSDKHNRMRFFPIAPLFISDIIIAVKPFLNILDCSTVLQGSGPVEGEPVKINRLIVSNDPFLADMAGCKLIGENPSKILHLKKGFDRNYTKRIEDIEFIKELKFIDTSSYMLVRVSMLLKKISLYLENISYLFFLVSFVFISIGPKNLIKGRWVPFNEYFKIAWMVFSKFEEPNNLLNWKITINKHVEQESIS